MDGKEQGHLGREFGQRLEERPEDRGVVDRGRAVERNEAAAARFKAEVVEDGPGLCPFEVLQERVDHDIADEVDALSRCGLGSKIVDSVG